MPVSQPRALSPSSIVCIKAQSLVTSAFEVIGMQIVFSNVQV